MSAVRPLRNFWILWVTTIILTFFSNAVGQASYSVVDLGVLYSSNNLGCAMAVNNQGSTYIMSGNVGGAGPNSVLGVLLNGQAVLGKNGVLTDLGTLGGLNSWMNWGNINNVEQIVGYSETDVPDPNGEDVCGFGTHLQCLGFLWQNGQMSALPTLGGNNGQASGINNSGEIAGFAETTTEDSGCPPRRIQLPVLWEKGQAKALPTVAGDPDGEALWINDKGQAVGETSNCSQSIIHAVSWVNGAATALPDYGTGSVAWAINNQGLIVGTVGSADNTTQYAAIWQNGVLKNLGLLPGDFGGLASGVNSEGQVVGSNWDSSFSWSHAFIYQNGVMTDLNTLFPASSNLFATMGNKINQRGQISGMAVVLSGPNAGNVHAFLATPVNQSIGKSIADVARTLPKSNLAANVGNQRLPRFVFAPFGR